MKTNTNKKFYWTKKRIAEAQKIERKNTVSKWKLLLAIFLFALTALIFQIYAYPVLAQSEEQIIDVSYPHIEKSTSTVHIDTPLTRKDVIETIKRIATAKNFKYIDYLLRLTNCENDTFDPLRSNTKGNKPSWSVDRGILMINNYHHAEVTDEQAYNLEWSVNWTIDRINKGYQGEWICDKLVKANPNKYRIK